VRAGLGRLVRAGQCPNLRLPPQGKWVAVTSVLPSGAAVHWEDGGPPARCVGEWLVWPVLTHSRVARVATAMAQAQTCRWHSQVPPTLSWAVQTWPMLPKLASTALARPPPPPLRPGCPLCWELPTLPCLCTGPHLPTGHAGSASPGRHAAAPCRGGCARTARATSAGGAAAACSPAGAAPASSPVPAPTGSTRQQPRDKQPH
jgi:hypothetical protein